jgi:hypothetical protein
MARGKGKELSKASKPRRRWLQLGTIRLLVYWKEQTTGWRSGKNSGTPRGLAVDSY